MTYEELFIKTIEDLKYKKQLGGEYELIRSCGLLRHLLLDELTLLSLANQLHKLKIKFVVDAAGPANMGFPIIQQVEIDYLFERTKELSLAKFISLPCVRIWEHDYSVGEIIDIGCYLRGGVHSGNKMDEKQATLLYLQDLTNRPEWEVFLKSVKAIVNVVIDSTLPLAEAISGRTTTGGN